MAHDKGLENVAVHWPRTNQYYDPVAPAEFVDFGAIADAPEIAAPTGALALHIAKTGTVRATAYTELVDLLLGLDGVLYATMYHRQVTVPDRLAGLPVVLLDASSTAKVYPSVVPDEVGGGRAAVQELVTAGHRRIGFATNIDDIPATHGRLVGYRQALSDAGLPFAPDLVVVEQSDTPGGYRAAMELLRRPDRPTGLFCFNDRMAMGAYWAAHELGLRIPDDVSVVGFDNQEMIADGLFPALTTVALPHYEMGAWAVNTMIDILGKVQPARRRRRTPAHITMECPLVRRDSVAAPTIP